MFRILVIGDIIVDNYTFVTSERQCSEAPLPVWDEQLTQRRLGGAANVALNLSNIDSDCIVQLAGLCSSKTLEAVRSFGLNPLIHDTTCDIIKHRYVDARTNQIVARFDNRKLFDHDSVKEFETAFLLEIDQGLKFDCVIISDYRMGTITEKIAKKLCSMQTPVFVDSKRLDLSIFKGAHVIKLNDEEYGMQVSSSFGRSYVNVESLSNYCVVTKGPKGCQVRYCELADQNRYIVHSIDVGTVKVNAVDVTGCGDTFIAALAYHMTTKQVNDPFIASRFANFCASRVVQKFGTAVIANDEIPGETDGI